MASSDFTLTQGWPSMRTAGNGTGGPTGQILDNTRLVLSRETLSLSLVIFLRGRERRSYCHTHRRRGARQERAAESGLLDLTQERGEGSPAPPDRH